jgi:hypothetical protein
MNKKIILVLSAVLYVGMVAVNYLAGIGRINNVGTGAVSDAYQNLFTPAGYAFSIWGLIYLLLGAYTVYQFIAVRKNKEKEGLFADLGKYFIATSLLNIAWIFAWHSFQIVLTVILMLGLLYCLVRIADRLRKEKFSVKEKILVRLPFSIYFGWISVATIANVTILLVSIGWDRFGLAEEFWTVAILLVGVAIGIWRMFHDKNLPYGLVFVWAYAAILSKHVSSGGFNSLYPAIIWTLAGCLVFLAAAGGLLLFRKKSGEMIKK